jgi:putative glutamine amidotransferase
MNVAVGGSLYQDIANQLKSEIIINHRQNAPGWYPVHQVKLDLDSKIGRIMRQEHIRVNSFHHQAVKDVVCPFCATGRSDDGVVEVIESKQHTFVMGVQWHPERMYAHDKGMLSLFKAFVQACIKI